MEPVLHLHRRSPFVSQIFDVGQVLLAYLIALRQLPLHGCTILLMSDDKTSQCKISYYRSVASYIIFLLFAATFLGLLAQFKLFTSGFISFIDLLRHRDPSAY